MKFLSCGIWARAWPAVRGIASLAFLLTVPAAADQKVSIELVLAVDVSLSVNDIEYQLQMAGIAEAFRDEEVARLIAAHQDGIAVLLTQWSGVRAAAVPLPWTRLTGSGDATAYAARIAQVPRSNLANFTALGHALSFAIEQLESNWYRGDERKIDVSGDGRNNSGPDPLNARLEGLRLGITINGLAIAGQEADLTGYYRDNVIAGPGAFVIEARDFENFGEAFKRKLKRELSLRVAARGRRPMIARAPP